MSSALQRSPEWIAERCGRVTASRIADLLAKTRSGWGASRANYRAQLVAERLTGTVQESYTNAAMAWGEEHEAEAIAAYEFYRDASVELCGFMPHPTVAMSGASPDGLVGTDGLIEAKCPQTATHIETLLRRTVPGDYLLQMQWQMACTGRAWCDWVSFDPRMPEHLKLFVLRVPRDNALIATVEAEVLNFLNEVEDMVAKLSILENAA